MPDIMHMFKAKKKEKKDQSLLFLRLLPCNLLLGRLPVFSKAWLYQNLRKSLQLCFQPISPTADYIIDNKQILKYKEHREKTVFS